MKFYPAIVTTLLPTLSDDAKVRRNLRTLLKIVGLLAVMVMVYAITFHLLMLKEGRTYSWFTGVYWTLSTMTTLGYGDITFDGDLGRVFSTIVLLSGTIFMLVLLPFVFIQFFWAPWMEAQERARTPIRVSAEISGHVILTSFDPVIQALVHRLVSHSYEYVLIVPDPVEAALRKDQNIRVMVGDLEDPDAYRRAGIDRAALVASTLSDFENTSIAATVRSVHESVPIVATANDPASVDVLELAGCSRVLELWVIMGQALASRTIGGDAISHVVGTMGPLLIAEASALRTPLVGKTLLESGLRRTHGLNVVGVWDRGTFHPAAPETKITETTILVLAGTREQLDAYNELMVIYNASEAPILIIGGGRVGTSTATALGARGLDYRLVEHEASLCTDARHINGNAADLEVLKRAGIDDTPAVIITTNDDATNVYLTIYCRKLRPDVQIITRANTERSVANLNRAGTDTVISAASMAANIFFNLLERHEVLVLAEGLDMFRVPLPRSLAGKTIQEARVRERSGATIVAVLRGDEIDASPGPDTRLEADQQVILIGSTETEDRFLALDES